MKKASSVKEQFINTAIELIGTRSYNTVGVQELCERVGVTKGSFYHYFPSKRDLSLLAIDAIWNVYRTKFFDPILNSNLPTLEKFKRLLEAFYLRHRTDKESKGWMTGCKIGNLALELSTQDEVIRQKLEQIFEEWTRYFEYTLNDAVAKGELAPEVDTHATAQAILAYIEGLALLGKTYNDPEFYKRLNRGLLKLFIEKEM